MPNFARKLRILALAVSLVLAAFAATAAAYPAADRPGDFVFTTADGTILPTRVWPPTAPPRGVILALHGFTDSRNAWALPAASLAAAGYWVYAPDQRGFGATASRGIWPGAAKLISDSQTMLAQLRARHPKLPLVLLGESMGGAVAMCVAAQTPKAADRYVFSSPAVWGFAQMGWATRLALRATNALAPNLVFSGQVAPSDRVLTDNQDALRALATDPLTLPAANGAMLYGLTALMTQAQTAAASLSAPALVLVGQKDHVVPPPAAFTAWGKFPASARRAVYLNGYHLLLRDRARALPIGDIVAWLQNSGAYLPSGADINAASWVASGTWRGGANPALPAAFLDGIAAPPAYPW